MEEIILCAAVRYRNGKNYPAGPANINDSLIVCGRRHHDAYEVLQQIQDFDEKLVDSMFGFITNKNRYLTRPEAYIIAFNQKQIQGPNAHHFEEGKILTSEDLYWGFDKRDL